ncbi:hypothetical protein [uncultured Oscillibacter sp.]|uniref:hypothetical protein n=1 Tax=uncultured Oscillibacter sp. TaxID=876091 RepID=UPI00263094A5|nr:hypothetical protein [uncultured Oscillibacter sp.]
MSATSLLNYFNKTWNLLKISIPSWKRFSPAVFGRPGAKIQTVPAAPAQALPGPAEKIFAFFEITA